MRVKLNSRGFTLIEVMIALAIMGLLLVAVLAGSESGIRTERFSGEVKDFADNLRRAQTQSYTIKTGQTCSSPQAAPGTAATPSNVCYWRGDVLSYSVNPNPDQEYLQSLIYGGDTSLYAGQNLDPTQNLIGAVVSAQDALHGLILTGIKSGTNSYSLLDLAFLAPAGEAVACFDNAGNCAVPAGSAINVDHQFGVSAPYSSSGPIQFYLSDSSTSHTAVVTFDPSNGTISTMVN